MSSTCPRASTACRSAGRICSMTNTTSTNPTTAGPASSSCSEWMELIGPIWLSTRQPR